MSGPTWPASNANANAALSTGNYWVCADYNTTDSSAVNSTLDTGVLTNYTIPASNKTVASSKLITSFMITKPYIGATGDKTIADGENLQFQYVYGYAKSAVAVNGSAIPNNATGQYSTGLGSVQLSQMIPTVTNTTTTTKTSAIVNFAVSMFAFVGVLAVAAF